MIRPMLLIMSISGSVLFLLYILSLPITFKLFSVRWRYRILKATLFFFLFPLPYFKYYLLDIGSILFPAIKPLPLIEGIPVALKTNMIIYMTEDTFLLSSGMKKMIWLLGGFLLISVIFLFSQFFSWLKLRHYIKNISMQSIEDEWLLDKIDQAKSKLKIKANVQFYESRYLLNPMTVGLSGSIILLPSSIRCLSADKVEYILVHELIHIKNRDVWVKYLGLLVIAFHWYNPISYWLFREICCVSEINCDSEVMRLFSPEHRKNYGLLLIDMSMEPPLKNGISMPISLLGSTKKITKRRIEELKRKDNKNNRCLSVLFAIILCTISSMTSLAYEPAEEFEVADIEDWKDGDIAECAFYPGPISKKNLPYDSYFTDDSGQIYEVKESTVNGKKACAHSYVAGKYTKHIKNKNGSCKVQYYTSERCEKCGKQRNNVCYDTETHTTCPH